MYEYGNIGPYELLGELGRGAMARVWRAWDPNLQREVAIKEPLLAGYSDAMADELGRRFVAEGRAAARLSHPGIVTIYAADVWDGRPAIVMELVAGETLARRLARGPMEPAEALCALDRLLDAVGYAHARGVVHRDVKPDNVFLTEDGGVKLADFGIARVDGSAATVGTVAGSVLGTPGYMSPEQATGAPVDARSDLFSVGVVAYEMLAGANPFGAGAGTDATTLLYRIVHEPAPELPASAARGLPADLRPAIMRALEKDPAARPQSAEEFRAMLHGAEPTTEMGVSSSRSYSYGAPGQTTQMEGTGAAVGAQGFRPVRGSADSRSSSTSQHGQDGASGGMPPWLPYVLVTAVAAVVLGFVLMNALGSSGGASSSPATASNQASVQEQTVEPSSQPTEVGSSYYLAVSDGKVAIFSNSAATPYEVSDVQVTDLSSESAAKLDAHVPADTLEEAQALVDGYRNEAVAVRKEAEDKAQREAEEKAKQEAEAKAKAEAEEKARLEAEAAAASKSEAQLTVQGADGSSRTATIHRQGTSERVFADSNARYLSAEEVASLSDAERCVAWNEIIASSNGYAFKNSGLANYFAGCSWYVRNPNADSGGNLSDAARANVELLQAYTDGWWKSLATY